MYALAGMLVAGFVCNYLVKPLADKPRRLRRCDPNRAPPGRW
jgi:hypothetical protein